MIRHEGGGGVHRSLGLAGVILEEFWQICEVSGDRERLQVLNEGHRICGACPKVLAALQAHKQTPFDEPILEYASQCMLSGIDHVICVQRRESFHVLRGFPEESPPSDFFSPNKDLYYSSDK